MNYTQEQITVNKINALNGLNEFINTITPLYIDYLKKGYKINNGNVFSKKDKENLLFINTNVNKPKTIRHFFVITDWSIYIHFDNHYYVSDCSVNYIEQSVYISDYEYNQDGTKTRTILKHIPLKQNYTVQQYDEDMEWIKEKQLQIEELKNDINGIKYAYYPIMDDIKV